MNCSAPNVIASSIERMSQLADIHINHIIYPSATNADVLDQCQDRSVDFTVVSDERLDDRSLKDGNITSKVDIIPGICSDCKRRIFVPSCLELQ